MKLTVLISQLEIWPLTDLKKIVIIDFFPFFSKLNNSVSLNGIIFL